MLTVAWGVMGARCWLDCGSFFFFFVCVGIGWWQRFLMAG